MNVQIIGTGNLAWFMANGLHQLGHKIETIYGRDRIEALRLANKVKAKAETEITHLPETDLCILAVSDAAIPEIAEKLAFQETLVIHHSGSVPLHTLAPCSPHRGVLWPILSIHKDSLPDPKNIPMAWEASNPESSEKLVDIIHGLGGIPWEGASEQRAALHLSAVMTNNFVAHFMQEARQYSEDHHLPFSFLAPLVRQTVDQAFDASASKDLITGPARRGDQSTLAKHQQMLKEHPRLAKLYSQISESIQSSYPRGKHP